MTASAPCSSAGSPCSTRTGFDYLNTSTGCATSCIDPACRNNAVVCAVRRSFPAPFLTGRIAPSRPPTQKNTPTPEGAGANAWLDAGAANSGCHAEGKKAGWHSGGFLTSATLIMQTNERLAIYPANIAINALGCGANPGLRFAYDFADLHLRKPGRLNFRN